MSISVRAGGYGDAVLLRADGPAGALPSLADFAVAFRHWVTAEAATLAPLIRPLPDFDERVVAARALRRLLFDAGWGRYGWPERVGGLGGTILHRAIVTEELVRHGLPGLANFEHLEIIAPTLVRYGDPEYVADVLPAFLAGDEPWAQGFSEPEAGSDLASLRTRGRLDDTGDVIVSGRKLWTSWAKWARHALVLVRTGTTEERHRGLTMVALDLRSPGVEIRPITQANGTPELAEVTFDDVAVPQRQIVGEVGAGWKVGMYLLAYERGMLAWTRHTHLLERFGQGAALAHPCDDRDLGRSLVELAGLRAVATESLLIEASGVELGPDAAITKLLMTRSEQHLYELLRRLHGPRATALPASPDEELLTQEYFFSKIVTVYGGSREMQLTTIAHRLLGLAG